MSRRVTEERYATVRQSYWRKPKTVGLSLAANGVWALGQSYCADEMSDGFIPSTTATLMLARGDKKLVKELVDAERWAEVEGGYQVIDYLDHNPSRAEMDAKRDVRRAAGARGGKAKANAAANRVANATANPEQDGQRDAGKSLEDRDRELTPLTPQGGDDAANRQVPTLSEKVDAQLALTATPGTAFKLLELLSDLHSDPSGKRYLDVGDCFPNDRKLLANVIVRAERTAAEHKITALEVIAGEWVALLSLAAADETPERIGNVVAYFAKRFGEIQLARVESSVPEVPARQEAA